MSKTHRIDFVEFPAFDATHIDTARTFYSQVFGWSFKNWGDDYIDTTDSRLGCGFNADPAHRPAQPLVVIYSEALEATLVTVRMAGGVITGPVFAFPGGRRFHFRDLAGNELAVWSDR